MGRTIDKRYIAKYNERKNKVKRFFNSPLICRAIKDKKKVILFC